ncbi:DegT/DnrJ/EryC1/StrS family aminotransferase, partial [Saccharothrix sp. MB29]|nr:DegT/DnrJ/EryC1/StrS family aminotransferase [Saccharothrix sp. MB29]
LPVAERCIVFDGRAYYPKAHVEQLIGPRTRGIVGVHVFGSPCPIDPLTDVAARHGLPLLFDAAHAFGNTYLRDPIGGFGLAEVFSFHATKFVNSFEGGAIVTNDDEFAERARLDARGLCRDLQAGGGVAGGDAVPGSGQRGVPLLELPDQHAVVAQPQAVQRPVDPVRQPGAITDIRPSYVQWFAELRPVDGHRAPLPGSRAGVTEQRGRAGCPVHLVKRAGPPRTGGVAWSPS